MSYSCLVPEFLHEFNSPLAALRVALRLAIGKNQDPRLVSYLEAAEAEAEFIASMLLKRMREECSVARMNVPRASAASAGSTITRVSICKERNP
jgi:hypothetical protein